MNMLQAIAESSGNKARATNDQGKTVIVMQHFENHDYWWHCWLLMDKDNTSQASTSNFHTIQSTYSVDPYANYWHSI